MKSIIFISVLTLFLVSCQNSTEPITTESIKDSATIIDSFIIAEQDKAINDIYFGISEKKFYDEQEKFLNKTALKESEYYKRLTFFKHKLGDYGFNDMYGFFYNDSLYYVELEGAPMEYSEYNIGMPDQYNALLSLVTAKYGPPTDGFGYPSWTDIEKGFYRKCDIWNIGNKTIEIRMVCVGLDYKLNLAIFKPEIKTLLDQEEKRKMELSTQKGVNDL